MHENSLITHSIDSTQNSKLAQNKDDITLVVGAGYLNSDLKDTEG